MRVTHANVVTLPDNPGFANSQNEWNADHTLVLPWLDAADFGADGTGDNTTALQAALSALVDGQTLYIAPLTYTTSATLFLNNKDNVTIWGYGAKIVNTTNATAALCIVGSASPVLTDAAWLAMHATANYGNEVSGVRVLGLTAQMAPNTSGGSNLGFSMSWANDSLLKDCHVIASNGNAYNIEQCTDSVVENCTAAGFRSYGIFNFQCLRPKVLGCTVTGGGTATTGNRGIIFKHVKNGNESHTGVCDGNTLIDIGSNDYWIIGGEWFENVATDPIYVTGHEIVADVQITNNILRRVAGTYPPGIAIGTFAHRWNVSGNKLYADGAVGFAMSIGNNGNFADGGTVGEHHVVEGNTFADYDALGASLMAAAVACRIVGNTFTGKALYTILCWTATLGTVRYLYIEDNDFVLGQYLRFNNESGINITAVVDDLRLVNNTFTITTTAQAAYDALAVFYAPGAVYSVVTDNLIKITKGTVNNTLSQGIILAGTRGYVALNHVIVDSQTSAYAYTVATAGYSLYRNTAESVAGTTATNRRGFLMDAFAENIYPKFVNTFDFTIYDNVGGGLQFGWRKIVYGTVAPATGTWAVGDMALNSATFEAGALAWVCAVAGTPGTWLPVGIIGAVRAADVAAIGATTNLTAVPGTFADLAAVQAFLAGADAWARIESRLDVLEAKVDLGRTNLRTAKLMA